MTWQTTRSSKLTAGVSRIQTFLCFQFHIAHRFQINIDQDVEVCALNLLVPSSPWISSRQTSGWSFDQMHLTYDISWVLLLWLSWGLLVQRIYADQFQMSQGHHVKTVKMYWEIIWIQELVILKFCSVLYTSPCVIRTYTLYINLKYRSNIYTHSKSKTQLAASSKRCG